VPARFPERAQSAGAESGRRGRRREALCQRASRWPAVSGDLMSACLANRRQVNGPILKYYFFFFFFFFFKCLIFFFFFFF